MLQKLLIKNYAIIDELQIDFHPHFNIITGETGAGKSILIGALGLVLGNRADSSVLLEAGLKCVVEAVFVLKNNKTISALMAENDLDEEDILVVRREIGQNGKSRSFINDTPVTLQVLRQIALGLVDLHQQFDTQELSNEVFQRDVVDALANHEADLKEYTQLYAEWSREEKILQEYKSRQANADKELDYLQFLYEELKNARFKENELEEIEAELAILSQAESIKQTLTHAGELLKDSEQPIVNHLRTMVQQLQGIKNPNAAMVGLTERLQSAYLELKDIADELELLNDKINMDEGQVKVLGERLDEGYRLMKKHQCTDTAGLLAIEADLKTKLELVLNLAEQILEKQQLVEKLHGKAMAKARKISAQRQGVTAAFTQKLQQLLQQVGMPNALLKVAITPGEKLTQHGLDEIRFLFDANKSGRFELLEKVASGGELSRLMLSIKSIVARSMQLPTLIFDEIDTGISGEAAKQVGFIMQELSKHHQLISITHQPQIAARANAHYFVFKKEKEGRIKTGVRLLNAEERTTHIAQMLSGDTLTESSLQIAREMVGKG